MRTRFLAFTAAATLAVTLASPVSAQTPPQVGPNPHAKDWVEPPSELPKKQFGDRFQDLDFLFGALKAAPDEASAKLIERRIWAKWLISTSDTTNLLMSRVKTAVEAKDLDLAMRLLDIVVELNPDYVEGWNRRATLHYTRKDWGQSLADIRRVLALEPRHFGALTGMGLILKELGEEKQALIALRKALAVNPHLKSVPDMVKTLADTVDGRDI